MIPNFSIRRSESQMSLQEQSEGQLFSMLTGSISGGVLGFCINEFIFGGKSSQEGLKEGFKWGAIAGSVCHAIHLASKTSKRKGSRNRRIVPVSMRTREETDKLIRDELTKKKELTPAMQEVLDAELDGNLSGEKRYALAKAHPEECAKVDSLWWEKNFPNFKEGEFKRFLRNMRFMDPMSIITDAAETVDEFNTLKNSAIMASVGGAVILGSKILIP